MVLRVVEGSITQLGSVSGTDNTPIGINAEANRAQRFYIENPTAVLITATGVASFIGAGEVVVTQEDAVITLSGTTHVTGGGGGDGGTVSDALVGADGIIVLSGTPTAGETTISGFRDEFVSSSGSLQGQLDTTISGINEVFAIRLDEVGAITYVGEAEPGTAEATNDWRIKKLEETGPDLSITWASGIADFEFAWTDRLILTYS